MTALSAAYDARRKDGQLIAYPLGAGAKVWKGALVSVVSASGLAQAGGDTAGTVCVGVAYESVDNTGGAAGALAVRVLKTGRFRYHKAAAVQADVGKTAFVSDDNTVATSATTNNIKAGTVTAYLDSGTVEIVIDGRLS